MHASDDSAEPVPEEFAGEVFAASRVRQIGKLRLLVWEARHYPWSGAASRQVATALVALGALPAARDLWRDVLADDPADREARRHLDWMDRELASGQLAYPYAHVLLFSGARVDEPGRREPRFPEQAVPAVKAAIASAVGAVRREYTGALVGLAGGASGGDLLFHESCAALGVPSLLRLTLPAPTYREISVGPAGPQWCLRFDELLHRLGNDRIEVLSGSRELPPWMGPRPDYGVWQRTNTWLIAESLCLAPARSLIALWDGLRGDGPGGTEDMVRKARQAGIAVAAILHPGRTQTGQARD